MKANDEKLQHTYNELLEYKLVMQKVWLFAADISWSIDLFHFDITV